MHGAHAPLASYYTNQNAKHVNTVAEFMAVITFLQHHTAFTATGDSDVKMRQVVPTAHPMAV